MKTKHLFYLLLIDVSKEGLIGSVKLGLQRLSLLLNGNFTSMVPTINEGNVLLCQRQKKWNM